MGDSGPNLLLERTLGGIFVHLFGPILGILLALPLYIASDHGFTRENARHVMNWHLTVLGVFVAAVVWILGVDLLGLPDSIAILLFFPLFFGLLYITIGTLLFALIGTIKAVFGTAWKYPLAPEFIQR